jgi:hypothetical protein
MLQYKDIKNLSELSTTFCDNHKRAEFFFRFVDILNIGKFHRIFSHAKQKGISPVFIIKTLFSFPFIGQRTVHSFLNNYWNGFAGFGKDAYYRLKNNPGINWRVFLFAVAKQFVCGIKSKAGNMCGIRAFVFDDTPIAKTGSQIEGTSKIWDHVAKKHILGFQLLVMGLYDGTVFVPLNFSFHREKGRNKKKPFNLAPKDYRKQFNKKRPKETPGAKRKKELDTSKIASAIKMVKDAVKQGITAGYVLTDSWFTCWDMVKTALDSNMHYIGMFSKVKTLFGYRGKRYTYKAIRKSNRKNMKRNKRFNLYYIRTVVEWNGEKIVLYCTRKGKNGNWKTLISTDLSADFTKTLEAYQVRWTIEVFFKECKQLLGLGKSQSNDFDAQIADTTITVLQYLFLAIQNKTDKYESIGALFKDTKAEKLELKLHERLIGLLVAVLEIIGEIFEQADSEEVISKIINDEKAFERIIKILGTQKYDLASAA